MRISDLAAEAGVTVKAVRYYEAQGLLKPRREANGYRAYDADEEHNRLRREIFGVISREIARVQIEIS